MSTSEEYLAQLGFDTSDMDKSVNRTIDILANLADAFPQLERQSSRAEKALLSVAGGSREASASLKGTAREADSGSKAWQTYVQSLNKANSAYKDFRRGQVTGEGGGTDISALNQDQKRKLLEINDAQNANVISALRAEVAAEQQAINQKITAREREDAIYNALLAQQEATYKRVANEAIAQSDKRTNAIVADYSRELAEAIEVENKIAAARQSARYATVPNASRNTAAPGAAAAANAVGGENYKQTQAAMSAYYGQLEKTTAAQERANQANNAAAQGNLPRLRYALYDVSFAAAASGTALLAGGVAVATTAAQYEKLFASVERTTTGLDKTPEKLGLVREQLVALTSEIPESFAGVTEIATLGNQLNIPQARLVEFTKTVAQFSSTTNLTVDASATAFGRLGQLLNDQDYRGIGDDISYLGVQAVATESQIVGVAQQIAVSANAAGFSTKQTLALATALASLGVAPEAARGSILRVFASINTAVNAGGQELNDFARLSGVSSEEFAQQWQSDASGAFTKFVTGLSNSGSNLNSNLAAVGITATRDVQAIGLLAQNYNVLTQAQDDTSKSAGYLDDSFGVIAETTSAKFQILQNNILRVFDTIGQQTNGPIKGILDVLNSGLEHLNDLLSNPVASGGVAISGVVVALGGAGLITIGVMARMAATLIAVRTAAAEAGVSELSLRGAIDLVTGSSTRNTAAVGSAAAAQRALGASGSAAAAGQTALAGSSNTAAAAGGRLSGILGKAGLVGSLLALLPLVPALYQELNTFTNNAKGVSDSVQGITDKVTALTAAAGAATASGALQKLLATGGAAVDGTSVNKSGQLDRNASLTAAQGYQNQLAGRGSTVGTSSAFNPSNASALDQNIKLYAQNIKDYDAALAGLASAGNLDAVKAGLKEYTAAQEENGLSQKEAQALLTQTNAALGNTAGASTDAAIAAQEAASGMDQAADAFQGYLDAAYGAANADRAVSESMGALGEAFYNNGAAAAANGPEIQKAISDIYTSASSGPEAAAQMQALFDALVQGGFASASQLSNLQAVITQLTGGKSVKAATINMDAFSAGMGRAAKAATGSKSGTGSSGGAAKAIRTLADYANDLSSVFKRASEIRFGPQISLDGITSGWSAIRSTITDANVDIQNSIQSTRLKTQELQATINSLASDNQIDGYFLSIAENYGDVLRASELRARIADTNAKINSSAAELAKTQADGAAEVQAAQDKTNKTLEGNSDVAIRNRAELQGLVGQYQTYITSLASSGLSQTELQAKTQQLKQEFITQATQLGYTRAGVLSAATAFDDMSAAIARVPRNITVNANTNPALQALGEFEARARALAGQTYSGGTVTAPVYDNSGAEKNARLKVLEAQLSGIQAQYNKAVGSGSDNVATRLLQQMQAISNKISSGQYYTGGYTGNGNTRAPAGVVHGKEFVLNAIGAKMLPMGALNAMNQGRMPQLPVSVMSSPSASAQGPTELGQFERQLLTDIADRVGVVIPGQTITQAANAGNVNNARRRSG